MKNSAPQKYSVIGENWDFIIEPKRAFFSIDLREIWHYKDLLTMFVKRDIVTVYKQTILGPIWFVIQPILTTLIYMFVFGRIAGISTDGVPQVLFYLSGITIWNYFAESFNTTSKTFKENANIFGKVYFPRLITPLAKVISALIKFFIQFIFFILILLYFIINGNQQIHPNWHILIVPLYVIIMAILGLGFGMIFTSLTVKYRDLNFLIQFGVQLLMYATPVIFPLSIIPPNYRLYVILNPLTPVLEGFKQAFLGAGEFSWILLTYSAVVSIVILIFGILVFNRTERKFIDTI